MADELFEDADKRASSTTKCSSKGQKNWNKSDLAFKREAAKRERERDNREVRGDSSDDGWH